MSMTKIMFSKGDFINYVFFDIGYVLSKNWTLKTKSLHILVIAFRVMIPL